MVVQVAQKFSGATPKPENYRSVVRLFAVCYTVSHGFRSEQSTMTYVRCINNRGYEASLSLGAIYKVMSGAGDQASLRVIDNEGEDYLYDIGRFEPVDYSSVLLGASEVVTLHMDPVLKGILRAEALAAQKSVSALLREWIDERLDLPVRA